MFLDKEEAKEPQVSFCVKTRNLDFMHDYHIISLADNKVVIQSFIELYKQEGITIRMEW